VKVDYRIFAIKQCSADIPRGGLRTCCARRLVLELSWFTQIVGDIRMLRIEESTHVSPALVTD
jgi:virulence-associated protein VapD